VGLAPELEYEPLLVVTSVHAAEVDAGDAAIGLDVDVTPPLDVHYHACLFPKDSVPGK